MNFRTRACVLKDITSICKIYNQGIEDRIATLETRLRTEEEMKEWLLSRSERHKVIIAEAFGDSDAPCNDGKEHREACGWASLNVFNPRSCYSGVADISIYIERSMRGKGIGKLLLTSLCDIAKEQGFHKLVLSTFRFNELGQGLYRSAGFREVGTYMKQGMLDGKYVDVTIMEKLLW